MNTGEKLIRQGEEKGLRAALVGVLRTRFGAIPESVRARMETADPETLQRWHERVLVVGSLEETFDEAPGGGEG